MDVKEVMTEALLLEAAVDARKLPSVSILAYTGGVMKVPGWGPIVIALSNLDTSSAVAILSDHDSSRGGVVGHGEASVKDGQLLVAGSISATGEAAQEITDAARNGFPWQASVGVEVLERRRVAAGEKIIANGRTITAGPEGFMFVTRGKLREVSIVSLGCDAATRVAIAASRRKQMTTEVQTNDQERQDQNERLVTIKRICGARHSDIEARAIAENWDENRTELEVLRAERPKVPSIIITSRNATSVNTIEAAILSHMGKSSLGEKMLGAVTMEQAAMLRADSMLDLCRAALHLDGIDAPASRMEMVKAAMSTYSLPTALGNVASKILLDAYLDTPAAWRAFCNVRNVSDFKTNTAIRPSFLGGLQPVAPGGELKHGTVGEATVTFAIDTYGKLLGVDRRDLINDDMGVFNDSAAAMGRAAMRKLSDLVTQALLANAAGFFSAGNGNLLEGADSSLTYDSLAAAINLMRSQRDEDGNDLDLAPATLLVPPQLEPTARALIQSEFIQRAVNVPTGNSLREAVALEVDPRLGNTKKFGNAASDKHWYLFASPSVSPMVVAFLNGQQAPTVEFFGLEQTVEKLSVTWRVYFDFGAALCDARAAVRSKGQA